MKNKLLFFKPKLSWKFILFLNLIADFIFFVDSWNEGILVILTSHISCKVVCHFFKKKISFKLVWKRRSKQNLLSNLLFLEWLVVELGIVLKMVQGKGSFVNEKF